MQHRQGLALPEKKHPSFTHHHGNLRPLTPFATWPTKRERDKAHPQHSQPCAPLGRAGAPGLLGTGCPKPGRREGKELAGGCFTPPSLSVCRVCGVGRARARGGCGAAPKLNRVNPALEGEAAAPGNLLPPQDTRVARGRAGAVASWGHCRELVPGGDNEGQPRALGPPPALPCPDTPAGW